MAEDLEVQIKLTQVEARLQNLEGKFEGFLGEIRSELKDIKANTSVFNNVVIDHQYSKDSLNRAFTRIEHLEEANEELDALINQWRGARALAYFLWSVMGGSILAILAKVFG